jgi:hypothetical protein
MVVVLVGVLVLGAVLMGAQTSGTKSPGSKTKAAAADRPSVYFVSPKNGATVKSPVKLKFGVRNFKIAPVPEGTVESARTGIGHHHVGVDTKCLPPGTVIPKAAPWIHFGDGKDEIDMQLPPGRHTLVLEIGDDLHQTLPGLCTTITVNVTE